ncbi:MAG: DUF5666 domain-containing protein [Candidatus Omnitrophica bacterium]|nr:DUF5666 domain-containing protein [Candidatus Omnitrophota bacterium]MDD5436865.1 DUF5666 domain-containing protein [Candidatus Omnitrophota bacterium]
MARLLSVLMILMALSIPCYCQDESASPALNTTEGTVTSLDWVGEVMSVNDMQVSVPSEARITKGGDRIGLGDINVGDQVTVSYYNDASGRRKAVRIAVQYSGDWAV